MYVKWQQKVHKYLKQRGISRRKLAELLNTSDTALRAALSKEKSWETVQTAIALAREMGTTVEYLFDPETDWPPEYHPARSASDEELRRMAIEALRQMGAVQALQQLAAGTPPKSRPQPRKKVKKRTRQRKQ